MEINMRFSRCRLLALRGLANISLVLATQLAIACCIAQEPAFFSGPQVGESMPNFHVRRVFESDPVPQYDPVRSAEDKPLLLVFIHDVNRQTIAMTRTLTAFAKDRSKDLATCVVLLDDDQGRAEQTLQRIRHALTDGIPTGLSIDGLEGPGAYGLNRKSSLTILFGQKQKVSANYALIQPSLQTDLPKIVKSIVDVIGGEVPTLDSLLAASGAKMAEMNSDKAPDLRSIIRPLIQKNATDAEVDKAAEAITARIEKDEAAKRELLRIATTERHDAKNTFRNGPRN
jgi:hypothetical protein